MEKKSLEFQKEQVHMTKRMLLLLKKSTMKLLSIKQMIKQRKIQMLQNQNQLMRKFLKRKKLMHLTLLIQM